LTDEYKKALLYAIFSGAVPLEDPRADLNNFTPETLLLVMNKGNEAFDLAAIKNLMDERYEGMFVGELVSVWCAIQRCRKQTLNSDLDADLSKIEARIKELLAGEEARTDIDLDFLRDCATVACSIHRLHFESLALLACNSHRIDDYERLTLVLGEFRSDNRCPPRWLEEHAVAMLNNPAAVCVTALEGFAHDFPAFKPAAFNAFRERLPQIKLGELLALAPEDDDFNWVWHREIAARKDALAEHLAALQADAAADADAEVPF